MSILKKVSVITVAAMAVVAVAGVFSGCSLATSRVSAALPHTAEVTAEAGRAIAADLAMQLKAAKDMPREVRPIRTASVEISDMIEVVLVEATRLPGNERLVAGGAGVAHNVSL